MYILFANGEPLEVHTDLERLTERKEFFEKGREASVEANPHIDFGPAEYYIGEVLDWEKVLLDHYFGREGE